MPRTQLAHMVYFKLKDPTAANIDKLLADCDKYLTGHPGTVYYSAGTLCQELKREVNDRDFDVVLNVVFASKADQDAYQVAPRHLEFVAAHKPTWAKVRVFDSYVG